METDRLSCELARRIRQGDAAGLGVALDTHWAQLVRYAVALGVDPDTAEDVAQQVFVRLWERREKLKVEGSMRGLLYRIARNFCFDLLRQRSAKGRAAKNAMVPHEMATPFDHAVGRELRSIIEAAINSLPPRRREVFLLVRWHGLSHREVAEILDLAPQTVANHLGMALADLRLLLARYLPDYYCPSVKLSKEIQTSHAVGAGGT